MIAASTAQYRFSALWRMTLRRNSTSITDAERAARLPGAERDGAEPGGAGGAGGAGEPHRFRPLARPTRAPALPGREVRRAKFSIRPFTAITPNCIITVKINPSNNQTPFIKFNYQSVSNFYKNPGLHHSIRL
ncbi:hypothetical protein AB9075_09690 [Burkholderia thailandensis]|uniref:hypothetical protein n=1 Tax=Burkholderia thailandensis TaxID=57975 RepID=UPI003B5043C2